MSSEPLDSAHASPRPRLSPRAGVRLDPPALGHAAYASAAVPRLAVGRISAAGPTQRATAADPERVRLTALAEVEATRSARPLFRRKQIRRESVNRVR